ncbi:hypothetical protein B224_4271 [Aeromonas media WS]|nr:hypothetical protein B224_4271 [Aeromonas media WS]
MFCGFTVAEQKQFHDVSSKQGAGPWSVLMKGRGTLPSRRRQVCDLCAFCSPGLGGIMD